MKLSVIIPCKNEAAYIAGALKALLQEKSKYGYIDQIAIVDNGSVDNTTSIIKSFGLDYLVSLGRISALRNLGAANTSGDILCFIDADVEIQDGWSVAIIQHYQLNENANSITGSIYDADHEATTLEQVWHSHLSQRKVHNYINGGNLIIARSLFAKLQGFDEALTTGEDYALCKSARLAGSKIVHNHQIRTIHKGYPKTTAAFVRREIWLGRGQRHTAASLRIRIIACIAFSLVQIFLAVFSPLIFASVNIVLMTAFIFKYRERFKKLGFYERVVLLKLYILYIVARAIGLFLSTKDRRRHITVDQSLHTS